MKAHVQEAVRNELTRKLGILRRLLSECGADPNAWDPHDTGHGRFAISPLGRDGKVEAFFPGGIDDHYGSDDPDSAEEAQLACTSAFLGALKAAPFTVGGFGCRWNELSGSFDVIPPEAGEVSGPTGGAP